MSASLDFVPPLDVAVKVARKFLAEAETVDIHDHRSVIQSHSSLEASLRSLLAALDDKAVTR